MRDLALHVYVLLVLGHVQNDLAMIRSRNVVSRIRERYEVFSDPRSGRGEGIARFVSQACGQSEARPSGISVSYPSFYLCDAISYRAISHPAISRLFILWHQIIPTDMNNSIFLSVISYCT